MDGHFLSSARVRKTVYSNTAVAVLQSPLEACFNLLYHQDPHPVFSNPSKSYLTSGVEAHCHPCEEPPKAALHILTPRTAFEELSLCSLRRLPRGPSSDRRGPGSGSVTRRPTSSDGTCWSDHRKSGRALQSACPACEWAKGGFLTSGMILLHQILHVVTVPTHQRNLTEM